MKTLISGYTILSPVFMHSTQATSAGDTCQSYSEEATSDPKGGYRLRGLLVGAQTEFIVIMQVPCQFECLVT